MTHGCGGKSGNDRLASFFDKQFETANNMIVLSFDSTQRRILLFMTDTNNWYGGIKEKTDAFEFNYTNTLYEIMNMSADSDIGFEWDLDLTYPDHLHNAMHNGPSEEIFLKY